MKYADVMATLPRLLRKDDAVDYVGTATVLAELRQRFGVKPVMQKRGLTVYDRRDLDAAIEQMKFNESDKTKQQQTK